MNLENYFSYKQARNSIKNYLSRIEHATNPGEQHWEMDCLYSHFIEYVAETCKDKKIAKLAKLCLKCREIKEFSVSSDPN